MAVTYVPRTFGGTLLITVEIVQVVIPTVALTATGRDGKTTAIGRDAKGTAISRDGQNTAVGRG